MKTILSLFLATVFVVLTWDAPAQGFVNLNFENVTFANGTTTATLPGWYWFPYGHSDVGDPTTPIYLDTIALDAPQVSLISSSYRYPNPHTLQGTYSIFLEGGTVPGGIVTGNTNGASIYQTGLIPNSARSLTYWGNGTLQVAFNGQLLPSTALSNNANYTVWGVDVSAYAGQTGELRFTSPWLNAGVLDNILFSSTVVPEPDALALCSLGGLLLFGAKARGRK